MDNKDIYFNKNFELSEKLNSIKTSISNILSTECGTVPGMPTYGSKLSQFLFAEIGPLEKQMIKEEIKRAIYTWEDRIEMTEINIADDLDYNQVFIEIKFKLKNSTNETNSEIEIAFSK